MSHRKGTALQKVTFKDTECMIPNHFMEFKIKPITVWRKISFKLSMIKSLLYSDSFNKFNWRSNYRGLPGLHSFLFYISKINCSPFSSNLLIESSLTSF